MAAIRILTILMVCLNINSGFGYIRKYSERQMCNNTITLGNGLYAVNLDFDFLFQRNVRCWTKLVIPDTYKVSYKFLSANSIYQTCNTSLNVTFETGHALYRFCRTFDFPGYGVTIDNPRNLMLSFKSEDNDAGGYEMLLFIYQHDPNCDTSTVRCQNGRCLNHGLFCDSKYNFCGDGTQTGSCTDEGTHLVDEYTYDKISIIGPICLGLFGFLVFVFAIYFCCRSKKIREICGLPNPSTQRSRQLTARDVYIINVSDASGTPEEGYDYVRDYKKFAAPPEYSSLENIAEASVRYINNTNSDNTNSANAVGDTTDGATGEGHTNEGFDEHEDQELPKYDHVMTNAEEYNVNNNHL